MGKIKILSDSLVSLIAAGEVVERPASVVKELVENSIDAGSDNIIISIRGGGLDEIRVSDNGSGIAAEDIELAFTQHATSKINDAADLEKIYTLGFRGEALASIASVSEIELDTTTADNSSHAQIINGQITTNNSAGSNKAGTSISIKNIFQNVPARRKFLKSAAAEFKQIENTFIQLALAHPDIHFELSKDNKTIHRLPKTTKLTDRIYELFGEEIAKNLYEINYTGPISITGYIGNPMIARQDTKMQYLFLNERPINDKTIQAAISQAYQGFIHKDLRPVYFVFVRIDPLQVDVNVHPRKQEVKFTNPGEAFHAAYQAITHTLQTQSRDQILERTKPLSNEPTFIQQSSDALSNISVPKSNIGSKARPNKERSAGVALNFSEQLLNTGNSFLADSGRTSPETSSITTQLLQLFNTYIVYEQNDQVVFVDQHAAAEKIAYEKLLKQYQNQMHSKPLLLPEIAEFSKQDKEGLLEIQPVLNELGFKIADFGSNSVQIQEIPELISPRTDLKQLLLSIMQELDEGSKKLPHTQLIEHSIATLACHSSIRAGQPLTQIEMRQILTDLQKCDNPYNCPHGRPVSWTISRTEVEKHFKRII